jgi:hypothetical protein
MCAHDNVNAINPNASNRHENPAKFHCKTEQHTNRRKRDGEQNTIGHTRS